MSVKSIVSEDFETLIAQHEVVFLDFWAPWCAPCVAFGKIYEKTALAYPGIVFAKINIQDSPELSNELDIRSIPHLLIIKKGIVIYSEAGSMPASRLEELATQAIQVSIEK